MSNSLNLLWIIRSVIVPLSLAAGLFMVIPAATGQEDGFSPRRERGERSRRFGGSDEAGESEGRRFGPRGGGWGGGDWGGGGGFEGFRGGPQFGGDRGDRSSRFNSMLDRNGDGTIDQDEIDQMPSFMKDMMRSRGIDVQPGMSVDDFRNTMRGRFGGGDSSGREGNRNSGQPAPKPVVRKPYKQKERPRITLDLPPKYSELDDDLDGQLAFHEWLAERRNELQLFETIDSDGDAYLTPQELAEYEQSLTAKPAEENTATVASRLKIVGPGAASSGTTGASANGEADRDRGDSGASDGTRDRGERRRDDRNREDRSNR